MREGSTGDLLTDRVTWTDGQTTGGRGQPSVTSSEIRSSQIFLAFFSLLLHDLLHQRNPIIDWIFVPPQHTSVETHPAMWSYQEADLPMIIPPGAAHTCFPIPGSLQDLSCSMSYRQRWDLASGHRGKGGTAGHGNNRRSMLWSLSFNGTFLYPLSIVLGIQSYTWWKLWMF